MPPSLHVGIDVGGMNHRVAWVFPRASSSMSVAHTHAGFHALFERIGALQKTHTLPVIIAREGFNDCARPLDREIPARGYPLYSVNNLKLARDKEIFPAPAKTDVIDARRILELIRLSRYLPVARDALQEVATVPPENDKLKRLTRRRRQLVNERVAIVNRLHADLRVRSSWP